MKTKFIKDDGITQEDREYVDGYKAPYTQRHYSEETILAVFEGLMKTLPDIEGFKEIEINGLELGIITKANWDLFVVKIKDHFNSAVEELKVKE